MEIISHLESTNSIFAVKYTLIQSLYWYCNKVLYYLLTTPLLHLYVH